MPEEMARRHGIDVIDTAQTSDVAGAVARQAMARFGVDGVVDAVGMEAHGSPFQELAQWVTGKLPDTVARQAMARFGVDRMAAMMTAFDSVRRRAPSR